MRVLPLAFDSLGTRSMATLVETTDIKILIDPGAALGPSRYGLPPHAIEKQRLKEHKYKIREAAKEADILVITHYHFDHYLRDSPEIFNDKILLMKDPRSWINESQRNRSRELLSRIEGKPSKIDVADGKEFCFGKTRIKFSHPFPHGKEGTKLGYVLMCLVESEGERTLFSSDIGGPIYPPAAKWIIDERPELIIIDGPATLFIGWREPIETLSKVNELLLKILHQVRPWKIIIDHHVVRDLEWTEKIKPVIEAAKMEGVSLETAAEFLGLKPDFLEARRRELYSFQDY
ncbi:MAG TPA: MBL fold metallo-hydrolase [Candidatus Korarchaeota archaeon]|nr:MBL fold metallo-hydrolase [Candidatus Korarchaeota archaeon]